MIHSVNDVTFSILTRADIIDDATSIKINDMIDSQSIEAQTVTETRNTSKSQDSSVDSEDQSLPAVFVTRITSGSLGR